MIEKIEEIIDNYYKKEGNIISLLQDTQAAFRYIPEDAVDILSERLNIPESTFFGITTFYGQFYLNKPGDHIVKVCRGTACHVKGSERISDDIRASLNVGVGETTDDGKFTVEHVACVGACARAPLFVVDKDVFGKMTPTKALKIIKDIDKK